MSLFHVHADGRGLVPNIQNIWQGAALGQHLPCSIKSRQLRRGFVQNDRCTHDRSLPNRFVEGQWAGGTGCAYVTHLGTGLGGEFGEVGGGGHYAARPFADTSANAFTLRMVMSQFVLLSCLCWRRRLRTRRRTSQVEIERSSAARAVVTS